MSSQESPAVHRKLKQKVFALSVDANSSEALAVASTSYISSAQFESMQDDLISSNESVYDVCCAFFGLYGDLLSNAPVFLEILIMLSV